ncbi:hypothetical protein O0I10_011646 [Lichtheimia ornata]|uniref:F-box domain-containing protein n=1 Tax=Lichtheimia ornata TaxID=688661 RepID=A0AAD7XTW9_9FUNG|nr:uncharacterized protein O0I10_011646 [Lichtheimia ornata]KAJ8652701.1 hypothetical protein O0I10_011646 [Lichtheimia ornata]
MPIQDNIDWTELLKDTIVTTQHCNDGDRIAAATETLQRTAHQFVEVLNERAKLLANSAQFERALQDAAAITAILPSSGLGYLRMGDVYCQQGHHAAAISIYDQGLQAVPESDAHYQQLQQCRMEAATNNSKRIDFISQLPLDIVITNIIPRITSRTYFESSCEYLLVSRAWQERILQQPKGLKFHFGKNVHTFKSGHVKLVRFAPYVQILRGYLCDLHLDDLFRRAHFSKLKDLWLHCNDTTPHRPFINGLELVAHSLARMTIRGSCSSIELRDIVETCPNLEYMETCGVDVTMPSSSTASYPKMTHLYLYEISESALAYDNMVDVLSRFPSLLLLGVSPMPESRLLTLLKDQCPYLQRLFYGPEPLDYTPPDPMTVYPNRRGVVSAHLGGGSYDQDDLIRFLYQQRSSLEMIFFDGKITKDDDAIWEILDGRILESNIRGGSIDDDDDDPSQQQSEASFVRLVDFDFWVMNETPSTPFMQWILLNAPNIKTICILDSNCQPDIAAAMSNLKHLSKVVFDTKRGSIDNMGIQQFLEYHIWTMGDASTLEEVVVYMKDMSDVAWIPLLYRLKRLKTLMLLASTISENCVLSMHELCQRCPALEDLTLGKDGCEMANGLLKPLRRHPNLKYLSVSARSLSENDLTALCAFRKLKYLYLQCPVPKYLLEILQDHIQDVEIDSA